MASANNSQTTDWNWRFFKSFVEAIEEDEKKKEKEMAKRHRQSIDDDFSPPGESHSDWKNIEPDGVSFVSTHQPGSLKDWSCFKIRKDERLAVEMKKERLWDSLPRGKDEATLQKAEEIRRQCEQLDIPYDEKSEQFMSRLMHKARKLQKEGQTSKEEALAEAVKKLTMF